MAKKPKNGRRAKAPNVQATVPKAGKPESGTGLIPVVSKRALSVDVGPFAIKALASMKTDEDRAKNVLDDIQRKTHTLQSQITFAIVKAAKADKTINLADVFSDDNKRKLYLGNQIGIALGYREVKEIDGKRTVGYAESVQHYFPNAGDKGPEKDAKDTFRSNWSHRITQCMQGALSIVERGIDAAIDKETQVLRISGPEVKKQFGTASVLLNERQSVGVGAEKQKLKAKPSFTAIAAAAGEAHGKAVRTGSNNRAAVNVDPEKYIQQVAVSLVAVLSKLDPNKITGVVKKALESMSNAIDPFL